MTTDDRAERLARLQARRSTGTPASAPIVTPQPTTTVPSSTPARRRSPALSAKVLTVGASTTAMLGMTAGYGIAEGRNEQTPTLESGTTDQSGALGAAGAPVPTTLSTSPTAPPPQVVVVVIDGGTGPVDADVVARAAIEGGLAGGAPSAPDAPPAPAPDAPKPPGTPAPAGAPRPVDVVVDVPTPVPVAASAPAPAPRPEATSSGS